jgi:UDP-glucose 4-epimerase
MIGRAIISRLVNRDDDVLALGRRLDSLPRTPPYGQLRCRQTDYSRESLRAALSGVQAIVHLAAMRWNPQAEAIGYRPYFENNVQITENLILAAMDVGAEVFCQASSISVYSPHNRVPYRESDCPVPSSFYGASKLACEHLSQLYAPKQAMRFVALRLAQILGHDETRANGMFMTFMRRARQKQTLLLWGEGRGARDAVYLEDAVDAFECALQPNAPAGIFNVGGGCAYSHRQVAETINEVFDNRGNLECDYSAPIDNSIYYMDCTFAEESLGWKRRWALREALEDMRRAELKGQA